MEDKIIIKKNPNGDTRTAKGEVSFEEFAHANDMHINDVKNIMDFYANLCKYNGENHDFTKKKYEKQFYDEFVYSRMNNVKFTESEWYKNHIKEERHHINSFVHNDVDLFDVLEMIADYTSAGLARSGNVREITIDKDVLYKAFQNTCKLTKNMCKLVEE